MADDLTQVLRDLNGKAMSHRVYYRNNDDGRAYEAEVFAGWMHRAVPLPGPHVAPHMEAVAYDDAIRIAEGVDL